MAPPRPTHLRLARAPGAPVPFDEPIPLGPGSLLWRYAGDQRLGLTGISAGILQLLHPAIGAGVVEHSNFFDDPWDRIFRSLPEIIGVVYDDEPERTGHRVASYHRRIHGTDARGRRYDALEPSTFWFAHATFQHSVEQVVDRFDRRTLLPSERERLYREGVEWYRRYGVSLDPVPPDRAAFGKEWRRICHEVLELTPAASHTLDLAFTTKVPKLPGLPSWSAALQQEVLTPILRLSGIGGLPAVVRKRFSIPWSRYDAARLAVLEQSVQAIWATVPDRGRWHPRAAAGLARARAAERGDEVSAAS